MVKMQYLTFDAQSTRKLLEAKFGVDLCELILIDATYLSIDCVRYLSVQSMRHFLIRDEKFHNVLSFRATWEKAHGPPRVIWRNELEQYLSRKWNVARNVHRVLSMIIENIKLQNGLEIIVSAKKDKTKQSFEIQFSDDLKTCKFGEETYEAQISNPHL